MSSCTLTLTLTLPLPLTLTWMSSCTRAASSAPWSACALGDIGRYEEMWGDVGRCGEMWGDVGRCGEM